MQGKHSNDYKKDDEYYEEDYIDDYNDVEELPKAFRKEENLDEEIPKALRKENNHEEPQRGSVEKMKKEKKRKHRKLKIFGKIVLTLIIILAVLLGTAYWYVTNKLGKMNKVDIDEADLGISTETSSNLSKYRNIAIFGVDSRSDDYGVGNRSDCIIIASINNSTGEIKLISVYRDTYVNIKGHGLDKITHAYSYGEAPLAIYTLNRNLDLNIKEFVTVNFDSVAEAVDQLGGITMTLTSEEVDYANDYIRETARVTGKSATYISSSGKQTLNGVQAVAYSRIRYTSGGDYKRTERHREVLTKIFEKILSMSPTSYPSLLNDLLPMVSTSLDVGEIMDLGNKVLSIGNTSLEQERFPRDGYCEGQMINGVYYLVFDKEVTVNQLHDYIFEDKKTW